jgi:hypothetical protein
MALPIDDWTREQRAEVRAAYTLDLAHGNLRRPRGCSRCGDATRRPHGHHWSYQHPCFVLWLCRLCHGYEHRQPSRPQEHVEAEIRDSVNLRYIGFATGNAERVCRDCGATFAGHPKASICYPCAEVALEELIGA